MPVTFKIYPERGLVYVRYTGFAMLDDTFEAFGAYMNHPEFRPGQKQLVDLADITGIEKDYARLFAMQAMKADAFLKENVQTLLVYYAPGDLAFEMAQMVLRSWEPSGAVIASAQRSEEEALNILGQPETSFAALFAAVGETDA